MIEGASATTVITGMGAILGGLWLLTVSLGMWILRDTKEAVQSIAREVREIRKELSQVHLSLTAEVTQLKTQVRDLKTTVKAI